MATTQVRVPAFTPSVNGLHFINAFPKEPVVNANVAPFGTISIGDASGGLCGGMVFTVRDVFETTGVRPIGDTQAPAATSPLFQYLAARLVDSFDLPHAGFMRYYEWMISPDHDMGWPPFFIQRGVAWKTVVEEWPKIKKDLDAGQLVTIGLVTVASTNPADIGHCHHVMAYGYDLDDAQHLTLLIYDPNTPVAQADEVRVSLSLANPTQTTPISHNVGIGLPIRGLFKTTYTRHDPTGLVPPPPLQVSPVAAAARAGWLRALAMKVTVEPAPIPAGQPTVVTVKAVDAMSSAPVAGSVRIGGTAVAKTNLPFTYTFFLPGGAPGGGPVAGGATTTADILAPGYLPAQVTFDVR